MLVHKNLIQVRKVHFGHSHLIILQGTNSGKLRYLNHRSEWNEIKKKLDINLQPHFKDSILKSYQDLFYQQPSALVIITCEWFNFNGLFNLKLSGPQGAI